MFGEKKKTVALARDHSCSKKLLLIMRRRCMAWKLTLTVTVMDYTVLTTQMTKTTTTSSGFLDVLPFHFPFFL